MRREKAAAGIAIKGWSFKDKGLPDAAGMAAKLRAKDSTLSAFGEHLRLLDQKRLTASGFVAAAESAKKEVDSPVAWLVGS